MPNSVTQPGIKIVGLGLPTFEALAPDLVAHFNVDADIYVKTNNEALLAQLPRHTKQVHPNMSAEDFRSDDHESY